MKGNDMTDILALLKAELAAVEQTTATMVLAGTSVELFAKPLTANDLKVVSRKHPDFMMRPNMEGMIDLMIMKCRDSGDEAAFTLEYKPYLMRMGTNKITEAFGSLFGEQLTDLGEDEEGKEARKGKSKATS
jgi:hypothetical protein